MPVSRLLKSCATPPASRPRLSSFCAFRSSTSSRFRSLMSRRKAMFRPGRKLGRADASATRACRRSFVSPIPRGSARPGDTRPSPPRPLRPCAGAGNPRACGRLGRLLRPVVLTGSGVDSTKRSLSVMKTASIAMSKTARNFCSCSCSAVSETSRSIAAAMRLELVRRASTSAGLHSRSVTQSSKPMKPHHVPPTKIGTVISDLIPCARRTSAHERAGPSPCR